MRSVESKKCTGCKLAKPLTEFHRHKGNKDGYTYKCKSCRVGETREYRDSNRDKLRLGYNAFYYANRERRLEESKPRRKVYMRDKLKRDPVAKLRHYTKVIIRAVLTGRSNYKESSKYYTIIGLTGADLINHLHSTFENTYGFPVDLIELKEVEIDHIIPLSTAKTIERVKELNHYTNLQLLLKEDNRKKGTKLLDGTEDKGE